jgi:galactonate dehydratase
VKITDIKTYFMGVERQTWLFVKIETDEGLYGWGEGSVEGQEKSVAEAVHALAPRIIGKDPTCVEKHWQVLYRHGFWRGGIVLNSALSAIDQALWDIAGKAVGVPVYKLLGGPVRDKVLAYTHASDVPLAKKLVKAGFRGVKTGGMPWSENKRTLDPAEVVPWFHDHIKALREGLGPNIDIMVDNHGRAWPALAIQQIMAVEEYGLYFFEEAVPPDNLDALMTLRRMPFKTPLATGERLFSRWEYKYLIEKQIVDIIQPDVCHCGGISELRRIAAAAETYYIRVGPHNPNGPVATMASIHLAAAMPNFAVLEYAQTTTAHKEVQIPQIKFADGYFELPTAPGLGIDLDLDVIKAHPFKERSYGGVFYPDGGVADV